MLLSIPLFTKALFLIALAFFIAGAIVIVVVPICRSLRAQFSTAPTVNIEAATTGSNEDISSYLPLRATELSRGVHLEALYEVRVPPLATNFGSGDKFKMPDDLKFEIQGVNVSNVITNILKILPEDRYTIKLETIKGATDAHKLEWKPPGGKSKVWLLRQDKNDAKDPSSKRMADRVIATVLYYMYYDPEGPKEWRKDRKVAPGEPVFPNVRALEAYFVGQQYLNAYLLNNDDPAPLENAELEFRRLQKEMPEFIDGIMLLGVTLSERRDEANAVVVYRRAKDVIAASINDHGIVITELEKPDYAADTDAQEKLFALRAARIAAQKTLLQAQLFQANAYRKLYTWGDLVFGIRQLDEIAEKLAVLEKNPLSGTSDEDELDFKKIGAAALAEKANSLGYGLILLYPETFVDALKDLTSPPTLNIPNARRNILTALSVELAKKPVPAAAVTLRNSTFLDEMKLLAEKQEAVVKEARAALAGIAMPATASSEDKSAWEKEKKRIDSLLLSAEGYRIFRRAQLVEADTKAGNESFIARANEALDKIHQADTTQPGQYLVLQNLGIIYGDPRYDTRNQRIAMALKYFARSSDIKPNDYFGLQGQAVLAVRQGHAYGVDLAEDPFKSAMAKAADSLKQRPGNGTVFIAQAQLASLFWAADIDANRKKWEAAFNAALANARSVRANPVRILAAQLQWSVQQLRTSTADPVAPANQPGANPPPPQKGHFSFEKAALKNQLKEAKGEASNIPGWEAAQLVRVIDFFEKKIDDPQAPLTFDKRDTMVWPSSPLKD